MFVWKINLRSGQRIWWERRITKLTLVVERVGVVDVIGIGFWCGYG